MASQRWCCTVCGYLHFGAEPPDCCPVCGATPDLFEPSADHAPHQAPRPDNWRCINCDHLHEGSAPPDCCPVCGVGADRFEPVAAAQQAGAGQALTGAIVIVGGGIAGLSAAEAARAAAPQASITLISQEEELPYYRLNLTRYLAGEIGADQLPIRPASWYAEQRISLMLGQEVCAIDRQARTVSLKGHPPLSWDRLILATGAHPSVPPFPGTDLENVTTLRTHRDAERLLKQCRPGTSCAIIGGGVLGLEAAAALARRQVKVTLLEGFDWLLPRQLSPAAGAQLAQEVKALGISLVCSARITHLSGVTAVTGVAVESGEVIPADLVLISAGVRSNSFLARRAGLEANSGVLVDHQLATSDPDIFAAGDVAEHLGVVYGTWAPSQFQGTIAGMNAAGACAVFAGIPRSNSIKVLGVDLFSIGLVHPDDASYQVFESKGGHYRMFVFRDSHLVGAILLGDASVAPVVKKLIEGMVSCSDLLLEAGDAETIHARLSALA
jgi:nitrite reductase (NADH) large subunit